MYPCGRDWLKLKRQKTLLKLKVLKAGRPSTGSGRLPPAYSLALKSRIVWLPRAYWVALKRRNIHGPDYFIDFPLFHRKEKIHFNKVRHAALL